MNFSVHMIPGLAVLGIGGLLTFGSKRFVQRDEDVNRIKILGVALCFAGAVLVLLI